MKKTVLFVALLALLAACSQTEPEAPGVDTPTGGSEAPPDTALAMFEEQPLN